MRSPFADGKTFQCQILPRCWSYMRVTERMSTSVSSQKTVLIRAGRCPFQSQKAGLLFGEGPQSRGPADPPLGSCPRRQCKERLPGTPKIRQPDLRHGENWVSCPEKQREIPILVTPWTWPYPSTSLPCKASPFSGSPVKTRLPKK